MWRFERRAGPAGGFVNKHNVTPMKPTLIGRHKHRRRFQPNKHCETVPEEPEMETMQVKATNPVWTSTQTRIKPANCKSVLGSSSPAFPENPRSDAILPATPANTKSGYQVSSVRPAIQMTPDPEAFRTGETTVTDEQNLAVTPESSTNSSMDLDTTFSSLPSPEIFREEKYEKTLTSPFEKDLPGLHIKNSTLLDVSYAKNICMYHPPNLSSLMDASTILIEKSPELGNHGVIEVKPKDPFQSENVFKKKTPQKPTIRKPILCKKKVQFKSPLVAERFEAKNIHAVKSTTQNGSETFDRSSPTEQIKPDTRTFRNSWEKVTLKKPVKSIPEQVKFFDFVSDGEKDEFFRRERQRCARLQCFALFPLTAAKSTQPALP